MIVEQPFMIHHRRRMQADLAQDVFARQSLVAEVVQRETNARMPHPEVLINLVKQHGDQRGLPIVTMDDLRMLVGLEHELKGRSREERKARIVIAMPIKNPPVEKLLRRMRLDEKTFK